MTKGTTDIAAGAAARTSKASYQEAGGEDAFRIERVGDVAIIVPAQTVENLQWELIEEASQILVAPINRMETPTVIVDLSAVDYFGSVFLSLLLRVERSVRRQGGAMVLSGVSGRARELLRVTNLDTLWAIYDTRAEALQSLSAD